MAEYTIDKIEYGDNTYNLSPNVVYATCSTAAATAAKVATITSGTLNSLNAGDQVIVKFTYANGKASPTLKVGSTDAKSIMRYGTTAPSTSAATSWNAGSCVWFVYDGTYWQMAGWVNTTYSEISEANITSGTGSTTGLVTGRRAKAAVTAFESITDVTVNGDSVVSNRVAAITVPTSSGTVTSVGISNATDGGITVSGSPVTSSGSITIGHSNVLSSAQTTQAVYPIKIDKNGHISAYGSAVTIPTIPSNNVTGSGSTNYLAKWSGTNTLSTTSLYINTSYNSSSDEYGTIKLYVGSTGQIDYRGQLIFHDGNSKTITITPPSLTASRTITLPDKTGTIALTSDLPTVPSNIVNTITTTAGTHTTITSSTGTVSFNVPTKTSHLTNDSGFITSAGVTSITTTAGTHTTISSSTGAVSFKVPTTAAHVGAAASDHTHGNITNGGDITATAPTIASGDQIIINDHSASKITNGPTFDGSTTTTALTPKGTWESFAKSDTNTTYALSGALSSHKFTSTLTAGGSGSGTSTSDFTLAAGTGITITDDTSNRKMTIACSVTNTDTKVSTAAITSGTTYYPVLGSDTTSAETKFYDKTGIKYSAVPGVPYDYNTGDAALILGNNTQLASNGWKRGVLRLYSRYDSYANLVYESTNNTTITLPYTSGTIALQEEIPAVSTLYINEDAENPGTYTGSDMYEVGDAYNMLTTTNMSSVKLCFVPIDTNQRYILPASYIEDVVDGDNYLYSILWFSDTFSKRNNNGNLQICTRITCGVPYDVEEQYYGSGEVFVDIREIGERYTINGGDTGYTTNISTTADQFKQLAVLNLPAGRWIVTARARFTPTSSSNHYSAINIGTSTAGSGSTTTGNAIRDRRYGEGTYFNQHTLTRIIAVDVLTPIYLNGGGSNVAGTWTRTNDVFQFDAIRIR